MHRAPWPVGFCLFAALVAAEAHAAGEKLYGVHWWDYSRPAVGAGPTGGWSVETVLTNSDPWQQGWWFEPLYQQLSATHEAEIITRVDYTWIKNHPTDANITVPAPTTMSAEDWANKIVSDIIGPLGSYASRWVIGNEPNLLGEGRGWADNQITSAGYAQIYHTVRQVIKAQRPHDEVLFAPVSPGGVFPGVRWMDGNQWLGEAIDATLALGATIDGFAIHAYTGASGEQAVQEFRAGYTSQLEVIDGRALTHVPVYLTEWNRYTPPMENEADNAANEQVSADFLRQAAIDVDTWNRVPGNHNIRSMAWFIYDDVPGDTWDGFSLEWWRSHGNPEGHPGDLWTAFMAGSQLPAGLAGSRPAADYDGDGAVTGDDWEAWRSAYGRNDWAFADGNRNGVVDAADYVLWRKLADSGSGLLSESVPEPGTAWCTVLVVILMAIQLRFRLQPGHGFGVPCPRLGAGMRECMATRSSGHGTQGFLIANVLFAAAFLSISAREAVAVDDESKHATIVVQGRIWTADPRRPWAEAIALRDERIVGVGSRDELAAMIGDKTEVIDAGEGLVVPGLIDSHIHLIDGGLRLSSVQLRNADSREEFARRIADRAKKLAPGEWITGGDWDHSLWGGELPSRDWIDSVTPENPVWINRLDGHMSLANTAAMRAAKVGDDVKDVPGGEIVRDAAGRPTGVFKDNALGKIDLAVPNATMQQLLDATIAAMDYLAERGVTAVHHLGSWQQLEIFRAAQRRGLLKTRIYACTPLEEWQRLANEVRDRGRGDEWLKIGGLKGFVDGSLGSHTAAFLEPFSDVPKDRGLLVNTAEDLESWTTEADRAGLQVVVHAIGDRAIRLQLDVFERVAAANGKRDRRFRIEHAQHIAPQDIPRFAKLSVIASMQPYHAIDDGRWAERFIGAERSATTYAFRSLLDSGARLAFGSDWFVAPPTPMEGIYAAVTRRTLDGKNPGGWVPQQKISVEESLRAYTIDAAYSAFDEASLGSLEPGKLADLVVLERNLFDMPAEEINTVPIKATIIGGKLIYRKNDSQ